MPWGWFAQAITTPPNPDERCVDGVHTNYATCQGPETLAPEPYLLKVVGDKTPVIMCEAHRADSQRDADDSLIAHEDIKFPRYKK